MSEQTSVSQPLRRADASRVLTSLGWRYILGLARTTVRTGSMRRAADAAASIVQQCGQEADCRLLIDIRDGYLILTVRSPVSGFLAADEVALVRRVSAIVTGLGLRADPLTGSGELRSVQMLEIAIDAMDIASIRPFWRAVLGYLPEPGRDGPQDAIVDPDAQSPAIWFQQMTEPRPQRNRIHLDISVPHDEAHRRIEAALGAGGVLVSDSAAPAFWVLADAEGNEACITTWQGRDV
ncbi:MAG TPA: VOC family protein [Streptosporangiaceae bacterium]|nr:VOC family protein [Streptosporangiaceae bacterium]